MRKRGIDGTARMRKSDDKFGTETNGADADGNGKKHANEIDDADVERTANDCDCCFYFDGFDVDDDCDGDDDNDDWDSVPDVRIRARSDVDAGIDVHKAQYALAKLICSLGCPYIVSLVKELNPLFPLDYSTLKRNCLQIYEEDKLRVKHNLTNMDGQISLSVDVLRQYNLNGNDVEFMCLTAHFIDERWKLKRWVLGFRCISDDDSDCLDYAALNSLKDWGIEGKILSFTLAKSDTYTEMGEMIKDRVQEKKRLQLNGQLFCVKCCTEMFSLMVEDALKEINDIIHKLYELVAWKWYPLWHNTAFQLKNALDLQNMGEFSSQKVRDFYDVPSADEWKKVECVYKLVERLYYVAKSVFLTKYSTANIFLHNLQELQTILSQESISSDSFASNVAKKMLQRLDKYMDDMFLVLAIASVMDPRCKMTYIEYISSKSEISDGNSQSTLVLDAVRSLFGDYVNHDFERVHSMGDSTSSDSEKEFARTVERGSCNANWFQEYNQFIESTSQPSKSELDRYLEEPVLSWSQDFNVLRWWRAESPKYPILSKMARDFLAIPMSVATSYDAFKAEPIKADTRLLAFGRDLRDALMCTRTWA
ncbi:hypothetical protein Acr_22g0009920 [Actinidia rufa]|uniref:Uncharacterized protein n=1 Tax=Actinidia rufa TaxID=165716 RepID=A0A7J0GLN6_9ERIC|nr:hypothetical protein Acr_22g0009920 [Actinidia rufa]